jgi:Zn-dependent protease with chaperone function
MKGQSSHSNVFVSKGKLVIYDSLFEHIREKEHMLAIIRHEMGHAIFNHIPKIVVMRILYYALFFVGMAFALRYNDYWLPKFSITYKSLFLSTFIVMQFMHFRIFYYLYNIAEHALQRKFEY